MSDEGVLLAAFLQSADQDKQNTFSEVRINGEKIENHSN